MEPLAAVAVLVQWVVMQALALAAVTAVMV
jgi:hypothetical protein